MGLRSAALQIAAKSHVEQQSPKRALMILRVNPSLYLPPATWDFYLIQPGG